MPAISSTDIQTYPAAVRTDGDANGGRMDHITELVSNQLGALFPDITEAQRLNGRTGETAIAQKVFRAIFNSENKTYKDAVLFLGNTLNTFGYIPELVKASATDVWGDKKAARRYGVGVLAQVPSYNAIDDETTIVIQSAGSSYAHFQVADLIAITNQLAPTDSTGNTEYLRVKTVGYSGTECTIVLNGALRATYATSRLLSGSTIYTRVASCAEYGDVNCSFSASNNTSVSGTFDAAGILPRQMGQKQQTLTLSFDTATAFQAVSNLADVTGIGSGLTTATWEPIDSNIDPMIAVPAACWGGTWAAGNSIQIHITPAAMPFFAVIQCQANSEAFDLETYELWSDGSSSSVGG